jgi:hypothetical protein
MILSANLVGDQFLVPTFNSATDAGGAISTNSVLVTPGGAVTQGSLLAVIIGGMHNVTINSLPSGWTQVVTSGSGRINSFCWKIATGSEPANYTFGLSGSLTGGWWFGELGNVQTDDPIMLHTGLSSSGNVTSITIPNYDIRGYCMALSYLAMSTEEAWTANSGYGGIEIGDRLRLGSRFFKQVGFNQSLTWSGVVPTTVSADLVLIRGRKI